MSNPAPQFIHLHTHSAYSLAEGAIPVKKLVKLCQAHKMPAAAITDSGNMFGALEFAMAAADGGVQPIIGCQLKLGLAEHQLVLLVQNEEGYRNLCRLVSDAHLGSDVTEPAHTGWEELEKYHAGLICLSGGLRGPLGQYLLHNQGKDAEKALKKLKGIFGNRFYIELQRHNLPEEDRIEEGLIDLAYKHDVPLVATNDCYFPTRKFHEAHDALLCIADGRYVIEDDRRRETPEHYFKSAEEMVDLFSDLPEAIHNTVVIAQRCHFLLKPIDPILPAFDTEGSRSEFEELKAQAEEGLRWRLEHFVLPDQEESGQSKEEISKPYFERLEYELDVIKGMGFPGYFLIVSDFIKWAKDQNIPVGPARGSGAGSVVAWSLKITDLDPLEFGLLFERFLNPERVSMPDFDVDFCQDRRDEVIRYVQEKYGNDRVAQIITFGKLQARAVVRDVGRVLQMPYGQVDRIAKMIPNNPAKPVTLQQALDQDDELRREIKKDETSERLITIALQLEGLYRHASTHAAGVVIGDRSLHELVPLYRDPRSDMPVTQFNMKYVEQAGLVKFDFLGLKTMTVIQKAVELIGQDDGEEIDILQVPLDDEKTYELMASGDTTGVFQLESSGMRDTLRRMKPNRFEDIIALVALYRPGPMDNIPKYIEVKEGREEPDYMHDKLKPYLEETYGIMIYQEQVMQAAQALAGYSLGSADLLRRAMGKKIQAEMVKQREIFVEGAATHNNVPHEQASAIFDQIAKFADYGFNKSHAAAYALIAYWTGWLKANYPRQFMAASMTLDAGNTDKLSVFKQGLDRMGIPLLQPDVNKSFHDFQVEGEGIRYALAALKGVGAEAMKAVVAERIGNGAYKSLTDFAGRVPGGTLNRKQMEQLAAAGAFECLHESRAQVFAAAELLLRYSQSKAEEKAAGQSNLFGGADGGAEEEINLPETKPWDMLERLRKEFDAVGFYLSAHPLDTKEEQLQRLGISTFHDVEMKLMDAPSAGVDMAGVLMKKQVKVSPKSGNKYAFLQMSDSTGVYEVMVFSDTLVAANEYLNVGETLLLKATAEKSDDQTRLTVRYIQPLDDSLAARMQEVIITLTSPAPLPQIKALLDTEGQGRIQVKLFVPDAPAPAMLTLPGRYNFSPAARNALATAEGVREIREI